MTVRTTGAVPLDELPGEAFRTVMLSSMRVAAEIWDARSAFVGERTFAIPESGWIVRPPVRATRFGLAGGSSSWKRNAPTITVTLDRRRTITGWVQASRDPNDDNVGLWAATGQVLREWRYRVTATR